MAYANEDLDRFSAADVLAAFGLPTAMRGPCPLCLTGPDSKAFIHGGANPWAWSCFACGRSGNQVGLWAALAGCSRSEAVRAIAQALGLSPAKDDPEAREAARLAREAEELATVRAERSAMIRFRVAAWKLDYLREVASRARVDSPLSHDVLAGLYREIGDCEAVTLRDYPAKGWL